MKDILKSIQNEKRFLVVSHVNPDGDTLSSMLAFSFGMKQLGKEAVCS
jgi:nanoRNase/pAp phosphatase (c-di-AMP/oligoRNAs hydrolase)